MTYSVWIPATKRYDYYEAPGNDVKPPPARSFGAKSVSSHDAGYRLPTGATRTGSGETARGMVATTGGTVLGGLSLSGVGGIGLAVVAYLAYRVLK